MLISDHKHYRENACCAGRAAGGSSTTRVILSCHATVRHEHYPLIQLLAGSLELTAQVDPDSAVSDASTVVSSGSIGWKSAPGAGAGRIELALAHPSPISAIIVQTRRVGFLAMHACVRGYGGRNMNRACPFFHSLPAHTDPKPLAPVILIFSGSRAFDRRGYVGGAPPRAGHAEQGDAIQLLDKLELPSGGHSLLCFKVGRGPGKLNPIAGTQEWTQCL